MSEEPATYGDVLAQTHWVSKHGESDKETLTWIDRCLTLMDQHGSSLNLFTLTLKARDVLTDEQLHSRLRKTVSLWARESKAGGTQVGSPGGYLSLAELAVGEGFDQPALRLRLLNQGIEVRSLKPSWRGQVFSYRANLVRP